MNQERDLSGGCWVSYTHVDYTHITAVHGSELEALRYALDNYNAGALFLPYGISILDALEAKENPQRG